MRLNNTQNRQTVEEIKEFGDWILKIGDREMDLNENSESMVEIPQQLLILNTYSPLMSLIQFVYPDFVLHMRSHSYFDDGAILCPTYDCVKEVNDFMLSLLSEKLRI